MRQTVLILLGVWLSLSTCNVSAADTEAWLQKAASLRLAEDPTWLKLGHYESGAAALSGYTSAIHSDSFFLSDIGQFDPRAELQATIGALYEPETPDSNSHAQCLFPARYLWLKRKLGSESAPREVPCPEFTQWTANNSISSVSVVYATGYLGNPASFYGHTFLKFNSSDESSEFLDAAINYGAVVPDGEDPIRYIFKGIFGGYIGGFSEVAYYFHNNNYGENELRDLWEYQLNLSQEDVRIIVAHAWEVLKKEYTYFFFRKNCAYRMAELLEVAEGVQVLRPHLMTMPQALIKAISTAEVKGEPLLRTVKYRPSRQVKLYEKYQTLSLEEQRLVHELVGGAVQLSDPAFQQRTVQSRQLIADVLLDYLQYIRSPEERAENVMSPFYRQVLRERYVLPPGVTTAKPWAGAPPHVGRAPSLVQLAATYNTVHEEGVRLTLRPAYYDVLDGDRSHIRDSALTMGQIVIENTRKQGARLRALTVVEIESTNGAVTGLPKDDGESWRIKAVLEPADLACSSCLIARGQAGYGYARRLGANLLAGGYIGLQLQEKYQDSGYMQVSLSAFANIFTGQNFSARVGIETLSSLDDDMHGHLQAALLTRYRLSQNADIRLSYRKDVAEEFTLSAGYFF